MSQDGWKWMTGQPRTCHVCGGKLRMTKDTLWLDTSNRLSYHFSCYPLVRARVA